MAEKEGKVTRDLSKDGPKVERDNARETAVVADRVERSDRVDRVGEGGDEIAQTTDLNPAINNPPEAEALKNEDLAEQLPVQVSPEEGSLGQAPVLTPGVMAPISSQALPNVHRDATAIALENGVISNETPATPALPDGAGEGSAYALAKLLERHPEWVNNIDQLDTLMEKAGYEKVSWDGDPVDMLEEAKRHNVYFIGGNGNFLDRGRGPVAR